MELQNDFTTENNLYPKSRPKTLHFLEKYSKIVMNKTSTSKKLSFSHVDATKGKCGRGRDNKRGGDNKPLIKSIGKKRITISAENRDIQRPTVTL